MKIVNQCEKCDKYYFTEVCEYCRDLMKNSIEEFSTLLCNRFGISKEKFLSFVSRHFSNLEDYESLEHRNRRGSYYKIIASIFYFYANKQKNTIVPITKLSGISQKMKFYHTDLMKYIDYTAELLNSKIGNFSTRRMKREFKFNESTKRILGKMNRMVYFEHIRILYDTIRFDNAKIAPDTISAAYIMLYYRYIRGMPLNDNLIAEAAEISIKTIERVCYKQLKPHLLQLDSDPESIKLISLVGYV